MSDHSLFAGAIVFWAISLMLLVFLELFGFVEPFSEEEKVQNVGGAFAFAVLSSAVREANTSKERPMMFRLSVLLLVANLACHLSNAFESSAEPTTTLGFLYPQPRTRSVMRFATKHVVATLLALAVFYVLTALHVLYTFVRWRFADLGGLHAAPGSTLRVLIPYANIGSGHKMAALALKAAFERRAAPGVEVILIDVMDLCPSYFRFLFQTMFQSFTQNLIGQHVLGLAYDAADKGRAKGEFQKLFERFVSLALIERVAKIRPDVVVCTHFLPAQVLAGLRTTGSRTLQRQAKALPIALVLTDLDLQYMWVLDVDHYFVPRPTAVHMLEAYGALKAGAKASVTGIPIYPAFADAAKAARATSRSVTRESRLRELQALGDWAGSSLGEGGWPAPSDPRPTLLYISSGNAVREIYSYILASSTAMRIIVCTGRQADVRAELEALPIPARHAVKMLGFVADNDATPGGMPTLLRCADLFVGKSGGLAVAEAAALCVPMIVLDPIPGQEQRNCDVLLEAGAACKINDLPLLSRRIDEVFNEEGRRDRMAERIKELGKPDAAAEIVEAVIARAVTPRWKKAKV